MESFNDDSSSHSLDRSTNNEKAPVEYAIEVPLKKGVIANVIKALRSIRNYSQTRLGRLLGVSKSQVSKLEKGETNITLGTMVKVFTALKAQITFKIRVDQKKDINALKEAIQNDETKMAS